MNKDKIRVSVPLSGKAWRDAMRQTVTEMAEDPKVRAKMANDLPFLDQCVADDVRQGLTDTHIKFLRNLFREVVGRETLQ